MPKKNTQREPAHELLLFAWDNNHKSYSDIKKDLSECIEKHGNQESFYKEGGDNDKTALHYLVVIKMSNAQEATEMYDLLLGKIDQKMWNAKTKGPKQHTPIAMLLHDIKMAIDKLEEAQAEKNKQEIKIETDRKKNTELEKNDKQLASLLEEIKSVTPEEQEKKIEEFNKNASERTEATITYSADVKTLTSIRETIANNIGLLNSQLYHLTGLLSAISMEAHKDKLELLTEQEQQDILSITFNLRQFSTQEEHPLFNNQACQELNNAFETFSTQHPTSKTERAVEAAREDEGNLLQALSEDKEYTLEEWQERIAKVNYEINPEYLTSPQTHYTILHHLALIATHDRESAQAFYNSIFAIPNINLIFNISNAFNEHFIQTLTGNLSAKVSKLKRLLDQIQGVTQKLEQAQEALKQAEAEHENNVAKAYNILNQAPKFNNNDTLVNDLQKEKAAVIKAQEQIENFQKRKDELENIRTQTVTEITGLAHSLTGLLSAINMEEHKAMLSKDR